MRQSYELQRPMHARQYGVPVQYLRRADSRVETPVAFLR